MKDTTTNATALSTSYAHQHYSPSPIFTLWGIACLSVTLFSEIS